jgi:hypothetical protein
VFRNREWSNGQGDKTEWMHGLAAILTKPPQVEILHLHFADAAAPAP